MADTELEKLMPRCKTSDKEDFPDEHLDDSERCWNCRVWEAIDKEVTRSRNTPIQEHYVEAYGTTTGSGNKCACGKSFTFIDSLNGHITWNLALIKTIQEEGTDNG